MFTTQKNNNTVSVRQLIMVFVVMSYSPIVRFVPIFSAKHAKEAAWLAPLPAILPILLIIYFIHKIITTYKDKNTVEIITDILGKYLGKAALAVHLVWTFTLLCYYLRMSAERMVSSIYPNVNITIFIVATLIVMSFILRSGVTAIARMGEIIFPILLILFLFLNSFLFQKVRADALLPVYFNDTIPVLKASIGLFSSFSYIFVIFLFSDIIVGKENTWKLFSKGALILFAMVFILLIIIIGILGSSVTVRAPIPFLLSVKQISVMDTIENIESIVVALWLLTDTILISTVSIIALNISKHLFKLSEPRNLINIMFVLVFIVSLSLGSNRVELDMLAIQILPYVNPVIGIGTPMLLFIVGKLRKKL